MVGVRTKSHNVTKCNNKSHSVLPLDLRYVPKLYIVFIKLKIGLK